MTLKLKHGDFHILTSKGVKDATGYIAELTPIVWQDYWNDKHCIAIHYKDEPGKKGWYITDINTGLQVNSYAYARRCDAMKAVEERWMDLLYKQYKTVKYAKLVERFEKELNNG